MTIEDFINWGRDEFGWKSYQRDWIQDALEEYGRSVIERCAELVESRIKHAGTKEDLLTETDVVLDLIVADLKRLKP